MAGRHTIATHIPYLALFRGLYTPPPTPAESGGIWRTLVDSSGLWQTQVLDCVSVTWANFLCSVCWIPPDSTRLHLDWVHGIHQTPWTPVDLNQQEIGDYTIKK